MPTGKMRVVAEKCSKQAVTRRFSPICADHCILFSRNTLPFPGLEQNLWRSENWSEAKTLFPTRPVILIAAVHTATVILLNRRSCITDVGRFYVLSL
ncbi:hypothetical protein METBIDRAFT_154500 [Metschnikowia bicuspidata var. bicuspidata NRRL YB-4993]|uniref:Uncharacterized protein n=1 Tax=Metschnikowia bicuspidata var. bicuspidata NRRL YB-4993 TaxID=869754 RepID=A0A1A0HF39_9ASCO|nr:hypothetical protein METBIDRAFT_154500 [Metschnikowia bicuspidata var. bicuspidata NRRL YB-4993]OBA22512.1 hypothetical protein METBIDRAFT_154500 [Metschnikowia bicuspidata var. bicuspidata NRRL YB-4993]